MGNMNEDSLDGIFVTDVVVTWILNATYSLSKCSVWKRFHILQVVVVLVELEADVTAAQGPWGQGPWGPQGVGPRSQDLAVSLGLQAGPSGRESKLWAQAGGPGALPGPGRWASGQDLAVSLGPLAQGLIVKNS